MLGPYGLTATPLLLAPMAGVSDGAFRTVCRAHGATACYTEMISAKALCYQDQKTRLLLPLPTEERVIVQLFGHEPQVVEQAIRLLANRNTMGFDLNMGCPAPKIFNNGEGCALMKDLALASRIITAAVRTADRPISVKFRAGVDEQHKNAVEFAKMAEAAGAAVLCIHGRTRAQQYAGRADRQLIAAVKQAVAIPVIANGDIDSPAEARDMLEQTGADALMIGRGALGNPFVFEQITSALAGSPVPLPTAAQKLDALLWHITLLVELKGEHTALREARKHVPWYLKGIPGAASLRRQINALQTMDQLRALCVLALHPNEGRE